MTRSNPSTLDKLANVFRRLHASRRRNGATRWSFWVDWLLKPASYGANMDHTRTYWCNKGRSSLRILWCNSSAVFSYRPRLCQRLRPNTRLLFRSCRSYASLRRWEMCLVCTLTTHTHRYVSCNRRRKATTLGCFPTSPLKHTLTQMSNSPSLLYNLGTMFIWCYWVNRMAICKVAAV